MQYFFAPVMTQELSRSWPNLMHLKFNKTEGLELVALSMMAISAWFMFANINEEGGEITALIETLMVSCRLGYYSFVLLILFDIFIKQRLFGPSPPATIGPTESKMGLRDDSAMLLGFG